MTDTDPPSSRAPAARGTWLCGAAPAFGFDHRQGALCEPVGKRIDRTGPFHHFRCERLHDVLRHEEMDAHSDDREGQPLQFHVGLAQAELGAQDAYQALVLWP
jgi:hypothetical protein